MCYQVSVSKSSLPKVLPRVLKLPRVKFFNVRISKNAFPSIYVGVDTIYFSVKEGMVPDMRPYFMKMTYREWVAKFKVYYNDYIFVFC